MKVSAVVPVFNGERFIAECLQSLLSQSKNFDEIIVVDDGSTDNTVEIVKKFPVKLIALDKRLERSKARNIGWQKARNEIIAFIESDSVYSRNWLEEVEKQFAAGADAVIDRRAVFNPKTFVAKMNDYVFKLRYKNYVPFSAWIFKKTVLKDLGGFDESLIYGEDVDLGDRLLAKKYRILCAENAFQFHKGEPKTLTQAIKRSLSFGRNMPPYYRKHFSKFNFRKFIAFSILPFTLLFPPAFLALIVLLYLFVFLRYLVKGMQLKFLFFYPLYVMVTEFFFVWSFYLGLLGGWRQ